MDVDRDSLDEITASAYSPDNGIYGHLHDRTQVTLEFRRGVYQRYQAETLESQLSQWPPGSGSNTGAAIIER